MDRIIQDELGFQLPVIGTEGGVWPYSKQDNRYPEIDVATASSRTYEILHSMRQVPTYFMAMMPWLLANREFANLNTGFEHQSWIQIVGWGDPPAPGPREQPVVGQLLQNPCQEKIITPVPDPDEKELEKYLGDEIQKNIIPLNEEAYFYKQGKARGFEIASDETDKIFEGVKYRVQAFRDPKDHTWQHIIYAPVPNWSQYTWFMRKN